MTDLAEFLLARIAEDENRAYLDLVPPSGGWSNDGLTLDYLGYVDRTFAECEAKRRVVELFRVHVEGPDDRHDFGQYAGRQALGALAMPYADHPDFREEWKL